MDCGSEGSIRSSGIGIGEEWAYEAITVREEIRCEQKAIGV